MENKKHNWLKFLGVIMLIFILASSGCGYFDIEPNPSPPEDEKLTIYQCYYNAMETVSKHLNNRFVPGTENETFWYEADEELKNCMRFLRIESDENGNPYALILVIYGYHGRSPEKEDYYAVYFHDWEVIPLTRKKPLPTRDKITKQNAQLPTLYTWRNAAKALDEHLDGRYNFGDNPEPDYNDYIYYPFKAVSSSDKTELTSGAADFRLQNRLCYQFPLYEEKSDGKYHEGTYFIYYDNLEIEYVPFEDLD